jgi:magnesium-transporting ATPase (P-type)
MGFGVKRRETQCAQAPACGPAYWAGLDPEAAMVALGASRAGLNKAEVAERLARYGRNTLPRLRRRPWYFELVANFIHLFALLLWAGAGLAWVGGVPQLAWAIVAVILINGLFSFRQEYQAERAAEALEALLPRQVTARRDGQAQLVPTSEIAPGDLLLLSEGEATPADARLISAERLRLDVSSMTGESRPIPRTIESIDAAPDAGAVTLSNLVFAGTTVASGRGEAVVFTTGANTEFGRIAQLTQAQDERPSPLQRELKRVTRLVTFLALGLGIAFFLIGVKLGGLSSASGFLFAIGIIVANIPEGLAPTLTLALALGVKRMARRRALVKRLSSVETLGATTVILADKTGTLTENEMAARELWAGGASYQLSGTGYEPVGELSRRDGAEDDLVAVTEMLRAAALCCDAHLVPPKNDRRRQQRWMAIGDPTEAAIRAAAARIGLSQNKLAAWPRLAELPFERSDVR